MNTELNRRSFLGLVPAGIALAYGLPTSAAPVTLHAGYPGHDPDVAREVVGASHARLERVRELVGASPALARAAWDWGFGDWESALGAASHTGRRDIAEFLIEHGARPTLFTHAMLGHLEVVKAAVAAQPGIQGIPGPHGITLLAHATHGGEPARKVVEYLTELGGADERATSLEITDDEKQRLVGRYRFGAGDDGTFDVLTDRRGNLAIKRGERSSRGLNRVEPHGFAPAGAADVRVRFTVEQQRVVSLTIHDPHPVVTAIRQAS